MTGLRANGTLTLAISPPDGGSFGSAPIMAHAVRDTVNHRAEER